MRKRSPNATMQSLVPGGERLKTRQENICKFARGSGRGGRDGRRTKQREWGSSSDKRMGRGEEETPLGCN